MPRTVPDLTVDPDHAVRAAVAAANVFTFRPGVDRGPRGGVTADLNGNGRVVGVIGAAKDPAILRRLRSAWLGGPARNLGRDSRRRLGDKEE